MKFITRMSKEDSINHNDIESILELKSNYKKGTLTIWEYPNINDFSRNENSDDPVCASISLTIPALQQLKIEIDNIITGVNNVEIEYNKELNEIYQHNQDRDYHYDEFGNSDDELDDDLKTYFSDSPDHQS